MTEKNPYQSRNTDFIDRVEVVCPRCQEKALVIGGPPTKSVKEYEDVVKFSCLQCGHTIRYADTPRHIAFVNSSGKPVETRMLFMNEPNDPYFRLDLWYRIETPWGQLWAYNREHLELIASYIGDKLRSRNGLPMQNNSIASRLPKWVQDAGNREALLKHIAKKLE